MVTRLLTLLVLVVSGLAQYDPNCGGKQVMVHLFGEFISFAVKWITQVKC